MPQRGASPRPARDWLRTGIEFVTCLAMTVSVVRTFLVEGYVIETGSMAPCLLGQHRSVVCPACSVTFAVEAAEGDFAHCPNCGETRIPVATLPRNDGDQLLVLRTVFDHRPPRRWEIAVFRNPSKPTQAFVKRIVGLPGETVQIRGGDVLIGGVRQAKPIGTLRGIRIPVFDQTRAPPDDERHWEPRWVADPRVPAWESIGSRWTLRDAKSAGDAALNWVRYRHWVRSGGRHATSVSIARWPDSLERPTPGFGGLEYHPERGELIVRGVLSDEDRARLLEAGGGDAEFRAAIDLLDAGSHLAPITDDYAYNLRASGSGRHEVRDLLLDLRLKVTGGSGVFAMGLADGLVDLEARLDFGRQTVQLVNATTGAVLGSAEAPELTSGRELRVEFSAFDRQALILVDGRAVLPPWTWNPGGEGDRGLTPWRPARFGARALDAEVTGLRLFRDVYYTAGEGRRGFDAPVTLGPDEYFALGDNSPVSRDSRSWDASRPLRAMDFVGKPFLVHLPSRKVRMRLGRWTWDIRIPEFSRIRYIR